MRSSYRFAWAVAMLAGALALAPVTAQEPDAAATTDETAPEGADDGQLDIDEILQAEEELLAGEEGEGYHYDAAGRRDPFISLLLRTQVRQDDQPRPAGVPGLLIDEIDIKGIFALNGRMFAQVQTADKEKSYLIQEGDQLYDGEVVSITANEVMFKQVVNDPSVIKPFREVVKKLNPEP
jgi:Tfp pilus assembly protein PilP